MAEDSRQPWADAQPVEDAEFEVVGACAQAGHEGFGNARKDPSPAKRDGGEDGSVRLIAGGRTPCFAFSFRRWRHAPERGGRACPRCELKRRDDVRKPWPKTITP